MRWNNPVPPKRNNVAATHTADQTNHHNPPEEKKDSGRRQTGVARRPTLLCMVSVPRRKPCANPHNSSDDVPKYMSAGLTQKTHLLPRNPVHAMSRRPFWDPFNGSQRRKSPAVGHQKIRCLPRQGAMGIPDASAAPDHPNSAQPSPLSATSSVRFARQRYSFNLLSGCLCIRQRAIFPSNHPPPLLCAYFSFSLFDLLVVSGHTTSSGSIDSFQLGSNAERPPLSYEHCSGRRRVIVVWFRYFAIICSSRRSTGQPAMVYTDRSVSRILPPVTTSI